ncbi:hypothetical protein JQ597_28840 [Bradyrhizobium sp. AUGA SZCCT0177]|uniref:hypothetical protein n=1 Tax=Bradyrhizobium sp. AUGA SZCCT0177 TaxID=2807665 RepID=UPI001BA4C857|nr:hypothetical protein [Bradyrhizobium sp. AUGA SZCCT0177]MBR1286065.1 hypothetical protein [Bradyrhizobium sp. AUGA SZCCT0177]
MNTTANQTNERNLTDEEIDVATGGMMKVEMGRRNQVCEVENNWQTWMSENFGICLTGRP